MGIEAMTGAAKTLMPEWHIAAVRNVSFFAPFKFYKSEAREVFVSVQISEVSGDWTAYCELYGMRTLIGQTEPQKTTHFTAQVAFSKDPNEKVKELEKKWLKKPKDAFELDDDEIYKVYFHGPAYQVVDEAWKNKDYFIAEMENDLPDNHKPSKLKTLVMPRLIEHCFQAAGIHLLGSEGIMGLPARVKELRIFDEWNGKKKVFAVIRKSSDAYDAKIVDAKGEVILELKGYATAEFPMALDEKLLEPFKKVVE